MSVVDLDSIVAVTVAALLYKRTRPDIRGAYERSLVRFESKDGRITCGDSRERSAPTVGWRY